MALAANILLDHTHAMLYTIGNVWGTFPLYLRLVTDASCASKRTHLGCRRSVTVGSRVTTIFGEAVCVTREEPA
jgi:hypothetical protein